MNTFQRPFLYILSTAFFLAFGTTAWAFPTYTGCQDCHGSFSSHSPYTSLQDGTIWPIGLMEGHLTFINGCTTCHVVAGDSPFLNSSGNSNKPKSCVGCHGRDEDVTSMCVGGSGVQQHCGGGAGLRLYHETTVGANTCTSCHTGDAMPVGEHVLPANYGLATIVVADSCNRDGTESQFGETGLDNDGDGQRDGNDTDCQESVFTINAGLNDAWVSEDAPFQGLFFTVFEDLGLFFLSWFTFDVVAPDPGTMATFGAADQRWVTGAGTYSGDTVTINVELTSGGIFNSSVPLATQAPGYGTITIIFVSCNEAIMTYNFPSVGLSGEMTLTRVLTDGVPLCEMLSGG